MIFSFFSLLPLDATLLDIRDAAARLMLFDAPIHAERGCRMPCLIRCCQLSPLPLPTPSPLRRDCASHRDSARYADVRCQRQKDMRRRQPKGACRDAALWIKHFRCLILFVPRFSGSLFFKPQAAPPPRRAAATRRRPPRRHDAAICSIYVPLALFRCHAFSADAATVYAPPRRFAHMRADGASRVLFSFSMNAGRMPIFRRCASLLDFAQRRHSRRRRRRFDFAAIFSPLSPVFFFFSLPRLFRFSLMPPPADCRAATCR